MKLAGGATIMDPNSIFNIGKIVISELIEGNSEKIKQWLNDDKVESFLGVERNLIETDHLLLDIY